jgi:F-box protein 20
MKFSGSTFKSSLTDGVLLCELMNKIRPGIIRKTHRSSGIIYHQENVSFFLEACKKLGLKGSQIFDISDIRDIDKETPGTERGLRDEQERTSRNICVTIYWLGKQASTLEGYKGPKLDETKFKKLVSSWIGKVRRKRNLPDSPVLMVMDENTSMEPGNMVWLNLNMSNQIHVYMYPSVHMWHACTYIRLSVDNCFACKDAYEQPRDSESSEDSEKEENDLSTEDALVCEALVQVSAQSVEETNKDALVCESLIQVITQSTEETNQTVYPVHMITQSVEEPNEDDLVHEISVEETPHVQLDPLTHPEDVVKVEAKEKTAVNIEFEVGD